MLILLLLIVDSMVMSIWSKKIDATLSWADALIFTDNPLEIYKRSADSIKKSILSLKTFNSQNQ